MVTSQGRGPSVVWVRGVAGDRFEESACRFYAAADDSDRTVGELAKHGAVANAAGCGAGRSKRGWQRRWRVRHGANLPTDQ
jgi:hypothetical protein